MHYYSTLIHNYVQITDIHTATLIFGKNSKLEDCSGAVQAFCTNKRNRTTLQENYYRKKMNLIFQ